MLCVPLLSARAVGAGAIQVTISSIASSMESRRMFRCVFMFSVILLFSFYKMAASWLPFPMIWF